MKRTKKNYPSFLFELLALCISMLLLYSCEEEGLEPFSDLQEGTYKIEVYDSSGKFVFSREGEAFHLAPREGIKGTHISLDDPLFQEEGVDDKFATLFFTKAEEIKSPGSYVVDGGALLASFKEQYYLLNGDWAYEGTGGQMNIVEVGGGLIKGKFTVKMEVQDINTVSFQENPKWGSKITVRGYFSSLEE